MTFPNGVSTIRLDGIERFGDVDSRFFLVRTQGRGDQVVSGDFFAVHPAVGDCAGNLVPGPEPLFDAGYATPHACDNTGADDSFLPGADAALVPVKFFVDGTTVRRGRGSPRSNAGTSCSTRMKSSPAPA